MAAFGCRLSCSRCLKLARSPAMKMDLSDRLDFTDVARLRQLIEIEKLKTTKYVNNKQDTEAFGRR